MTTKKIMRICESMIHDERIDDDSKGIISEYVEEIMDAVIDNSSQGRCEEDDDDDDEFIEDELSRMKRKYSNTKDVIDRLRDYLDDDDDDYDDEDDDDYFDD